jgi:hypothetical protein
MPCKWGEEQQWACVACIPSAPAHAPLSHWTSFTEYKFKDKIIKNFKTAGCRWLIPVILAIQEGEISRIEILGQPWQKKKSLQDPISIEKKAGHGGSCLSSRYHKIRTGSLDKKQDPISKMTTAKRARIVAQVAGHLHSK